MYLILRNIYTNGINLVIGDLGHAKYLSDISRRRSISRTIFGTDGYHAPEVTSHYDSKIDIWLFLLFDEMKLFLK